MNAPVRRVTPASASDGDMRAATGRYHLRGLMGGANQLAGVAKSASYELQYESLRLKEEGVVEAPAEHQFLLAALPPSPGQRRMALAIVLILLIAFLIMVPFRTIQLPPSASFIAVFSSVVLINDLITATLLFSQFWILRWRALAVLGAGYLFSALISIPYVLTFPGVFSPTGLLGAGPHTAGWLFMIWHCGLPLAVIFYAILKDEDRTRKMTYASARATISLSVTLVIAVVCALTWIVIALGNDVLPPMFLDAFNVTQLGRNIAIVVASLCTLALGVLWVRRRSALDLWLIVVLWVWLLEIAFFALFTAPRYSLSFYARRFYALTAVSVVLLALLFETITLYARLARSMEMWRREREAQLMTMNAISASIAHELSQPLGAMLANSEAALLWLARTPPELTKVRASVESVASDGQRASEVIASVRALFQKDTSEKELTDVNNLILEALEIERAQLQAHGVSVEVKLAEKLPPVLAVRHQLQQVILNLIMNAEQAMGSVTDRARVLRVKSDIHESNDVLIAIEDSGPGIDPKYSDRIFELFFTTKPRGMGLGLWICRTIIEYHNGQLTVSTGTNCGAVFQFVLPGGKAGDK